MRARRRSLAACLSLALVLGPAACRRRGAVDERQKAFLDLESTQYVSIPAGTFERGCVPQDAACAEDEKPRHRVEITGGFSMRRTEVTVGAYRRFASATGRLMPEGAGSTAADEHPVANVSWYEAQAYCEEAGGRLPTEAEWEYAARGGTAGTVYPWGDTLGPEHANYKGASGTDRWEEVAPVGSFAANGFGLHDMAGNVWEWCADRYALDAYAGAAAVVDPQGPAAGHQRVFRGGSWHGNPQGLRASDRDASDPGRRFGNVGFRCVR